MTANGITIRRKRRVKSSLNKENDAPIDKNSANNGPLLLADFEACTKDDELLAISESILEASLNRNFQIVLVENLDSIVSKARDLVKTAAAGKSVLKSLIVSIHIIRAVWTLEKHRDLLIRLLYHIITASLKAVESSNAEESAKLADCGLAALETLGSLCDSLIAPSKDGRYVLFKQKDDSLFPVPVIQKSTKKELSSLTSDQLLSIGIASLNAGAQLLLKLKNASKKSDLVRLSRFRMNGALVIDTIESLIVHAQPPWILALSSVKPDTLEVHMKQSRKLLTDLAKVVPSQRPRLYTMAIKFQATLQLSHKSSTERLGKICRIAIQYAKMFDNPSKELTAFHESVGSLLDGLVDPMMLPLAYVEYCASRALHTNLPCGTMCEADCCFQPTGLPFNHICGPVPATPPERFFLVYSAMLQVKAALLANSSISIDLVDVKHQVADFMSSENRPEARELFCKLFAAIGLEKVLNNHLKGTNVCHNEVATATVLLSECLGPLALQVAGLSSKSVEYWNVCSWAFSVSISSIDVLDREDFGMLKTILDSSIPFEHRERIGRLLYSQAISRRDGGSNCCSHMSYALAFLQSIPNSPEYVISKRLSVLSSLFAEQGDNDKALLACMTSIAMEMSSPPNDHVVDESSILLSLCHRCSEILLGQCPNDFGNKLSGRIRELAVLLSRRETDTRRSTLYKELTIADALTMLCNERMANLFNDKYEAGFGFQSLFHAMMINGKCDAGESVAFLAELLHQFKAINEENTFTECSVEGTLSMGFELIMRLQLDRPAEALAISLLRLIVVLKKGDDLIPSQPRIKDDGKSENTATQVNVLREVCEALEATEETPATIGRLAKITIILTKLRMFDILRKDRDCGWLKSIDNLDFLEMRRSCFEILTSSSQDKSALALFVTQSTIAGVLRLSEIQLLFGEDLDSLSTLRTLADSPTLAEEYRGIVNASIFSILSSDRISSGLVVANLRHGLLPDDDDELLRASLLRYLACTAPDTNKVKHDILHWLDTISSSHTEKRDSKAFVGRCLKVCLLMGLSECCGRNGDSRGQLKALLRCLDESKRIVSVQRQLDNIEKLKSFRERALPWHLFYRSYETKIDCLHRLSDVYLRIGDHRNCLVYSCRYGNAIIGDAFSATLRSASSKARFESIVAIVASSSRRSVQDHRWKRQLLRLTSHCFSPDSVSKALSTHWGQSVATLKDVLTADCYRDIEAIKDASEVQRMLGGHDLSKLSENTLEAYQRYILDPEYLSDIPIGCKNACQAYKEVLPQLRCDRRLDSFSTSPNQMTFESKRALLEGNTNAVGCTNDTRCWSLYLLGLAALNEGKSCGDLGKLWEDVALGETTAILKARCFFEKALIGLGSSATDLKRKVQRSLALVLGPNERSKVLGINASDLIHLSLNQATSNRIKTRLQQISDDTDEWIQESVRELHEGKRFLPRSMKFLAMASCPSGELLLNIIDGSGHDQTSCIFPSSSESIADALLRPLSDLLAASNDQLEKSSAIEKDDLTARRRWRRDRREIDESFRQLMRKTTELFTSASLPTLSQELLFNRTTGNLTSLFEKVANDQEDQRPKSETCLILLLDEFLQKFPFESLDFFEDAAICRLPSLFFAFETQHSVYQVQQDNVSFILNPESDLDETEERLLPVLRDLGGSDWKSYVREKPPNEELCHALAKESGLVMYFGHGGGERLISQDQLELLKKDGMRSSMILMGCSSGLVHSPNQIKSSYSPCSIHFEPDGSILQYLLLGVPCAVGNLWDVTDRDIDIFTESMLRSLFEHGQSIAQSVASARSTCKFRFLTGGAPVCYGLPFAVCSPDRE